MKRKNILFIFIFLMVLSSLCITFVQNWPTKFTNDASTHAEKLPTPTVTPFLFQEMTIPYLRSRTYASSLDKLDLESEHGTYISYLTSYNSDTLKIYAQLTKPTGAPPNGGWPAIVFIHGYIPPSQYETLRKYIAYVDALARDGFVVLKIDLRGHGKSEGIPGGGYYSSDYVIDTLNAYAALQSTDFVNPKKIGLWGHSMAGNIVLRSLAIRADIPAAVIWAGAGYTYTDLREYRITDFSYRPQPSDAPNQLRRQKLLNTYGNPDPDNWFWKLVIPTNYLSDIKGAIQIHHAVNDDVVNIAYSRNLNSLLDNTSIPHTLYEYPTGGHNISDPSFGIAMQRTIEFYQSMSDTVK